MADLTLRLVKGTALTNSELDGNFEYFTGSHAITGSLTVSGSVIPSDVSGTLGTSASLWSTINLDGSGINGAAIAIHSGSNSGTLTWNSGSGFLFSDVINSPTITGSFTVNTLGAPTLSGSIGAITLSYPSGAILTPTASLATSAPTFNASEGQFMFGSGSDGYKMFVYLGGAWRSGSLS